VVVTLSVLLMREQFQTHEELVAFQEYGLAHTQVPLVVVTLSVLLMREQFQTQLMFVAFQEYGLLHSQLPLVVFPVFEVFVLEMFEQFNRQVKLCPSHVYGVLHTQVEKFPVCAVRLVLLMLLQLMLHWSVLELKV
jgi:hypothetical protein